MSRAVVIEDNETMRDGLVLVLERAGHAVRAAKSGREGLELVRSEAPTW